MATKKKATGKKQAAGTSTGKSTKKASPKKSVAASKKKTTTVKKTAQKKSGAVPKKTKSAAAKSARSKKNPATSILPKERYQLIAERAYLRAEQRGFVGGDPTQDWLEAEKEIDAILSPAS